jgi:hypothetical protein
MNKDDIRIIALTIAKANNHPTPEQYADLAASNFEQVTAVSVPFPILPEPVIETPIPEPVIETPLSEPEVVIDVSAVAGQAFTDISTVGV